jgi:hypothetical protein
VRPKDPAHRLLEDLMQQPGVSSEAGRWGRSGLEYLVVLAVDLVVYPVIHSVIHLVLDPVAGPLLDLSPSPVELQDLQKEHSAA